MTTPSARFARRQFLGALAVTILNAPWTLLSGKTPTVAYAQDRPAQLEATSSATPAARADAVLRPSRERRAEWAASRAADRHAVVLVGDSLVEAWGDQLARDIPGLKIANRGLRGDTSGGVLARLKEDVLALEPRAVVLAVGSEELAAGAPVEAMAHHVQQLIEELERHDPNLPLIVCQLMPGPGAERGQVEAVQAANVALLNVLRNRANVILLETAQLLSTKEGEADPQSFSDRLHLSPTGYAKWSAALRPVLETLGFGTFVPDDFTVEPGFTALFNGRDLSGWGYRPVPAGDIEAARKRDATSKQPPARVFPERRVDFDGKERTPDGRYAAIRGRLVVTTPPEYRKIQQLWTQREFNTDFVLRVQFRATPNADSGIYLRGPQLQVRDYGLAGPYAIEAYRPQDWNDLEVTVRGTSARVTCNGELIEGAFALPAGGPIGIEGDRGQVEYRRIRVQVLP